MLQKILELLSLPNNYEWVIRSGSQKGYHIIFKWSEETNDGGLPLYRSIPYKVVCLLPNLSYYDYFKQIELRFQGHMVLPPSIHPSYNCYSFKNGKLPENGLKYIENKNFQYLSDHLCAKSFYSFVQDSQGYNEELLYEDTILKALENGKVLGNFTPTPPYFLFIDVETNGLPLKYDSPTTDLLNWPRVIEIGWAVFDKHKNIIIKNNIFITPEGFEIDQYYVQFTKRNERIKDANKDSISNALDIINKWIEKSDYIVGHNIEFDINCLLSEYNRSNTLDQLSSKRTICTMKESTDFCKLTSTRGYKYPKLEELYFKIFNKTLEQTHGADLDIITTAKCFWYLKDNNIIKIDA